MLARLQSAAGSSRVGELGMGELIVILLLIVVLFGASRLPRAAAGLGKAIRSFKDAMAGKDEPHAGDAGAEARRRDPGGGKAP